MSAPYQILSHVNVPQKSLIKGSHHKGPTRDPYTTRDVSTHFFRYKVIIKDIGLFKYVYFNEILSFIFLINL